MGRAGAGFDPLFIATRLGARRRASEGARERGGRRRDTHPEVYSPAPIINALIIFASCVVNAVRDDVCSDASRPDVVSWQHWSNLPTVIRNDDGERTGTS